jgi:MazG family protein
VSHLDRLLAIMARLRDPDDGCRWDLEQDFESIAPYTIEEAYEVDHAIRAGDMEALREELGDLLLQVVYHARMAEERGLFDFEQVARAIGDKLIARHPHVFGDEAVAISPDEQRQRWEAYKEAERARKREARGQSPDAAPDPFEDIPHALPALARAAKLQRRAGRVSGTADALDSKAALEALQTALARLPGIAPASSPDGDAAAESPPEAATRAALGELLFAIVQLATASGQDAERALREANAAFELRVRAGSGEPDSR